MAFDTLSQFVQTQVKFPYTTGEEGVGTDDDSESDKLLARYVGLHD